jgi:ABC-type oligopeptide transport system substrate-binding subunit
MGNPLINLNGLLGKRVAPRRDGITIIGLIFDIKKPILFNIMKRFYYILILISIVFYKNNIYANCKNTYTNHESYTYTQKTAIKYQLNFTHLNYADTNAKQGGLLQIANQYQFNDLNPFSPIGQTPTNYPMAVFDSLFMAPLDDINTLQPLIAQSYCINNNTLTIIINKKAQWINNQPITTLDIKATLDYLKYINHPYYNHLMLSIKNIKIINDLKMQISFININNNAIITLFTLPIVYHLDIQNLGVNLLNKIPHSSGNYYVKSFEENKLILNRNHNYWGKNMGLKKYQFNFDSIVISYFYNNKKQLIAFDNNQLSIYAIVDLENLDNYKAKYPDEFVKIQKNNAQPLNALFINTTKPYLTDINVRKAIYLAFDAQELKKNLNNEALILNTNRHNTKNNLIEASKILDNTDYIFINNKRIHKVNQQQLSLHIIFSNTYEENLFKHFLENLKILGIKVNSQILNGSQIKDSIKNNNFDIIQSSYLYGNPIGEEIYYYFFDYNKTNSIYNLNKLNNQTINDLILSILNTKNIRQKNIKLKELNYTLSSLYIFIPTYYYAHDFYLIKNNLNYKQSDFGLDIWSSYFK